MAATNSINTPSKRQKLSPRREPYWYGFAKGKALGFRKLSNGGTWMQQSYNRTASYLYRKSTLTTVTPSQNG